jgi:Spy/CpxP family protein refolding chaperone
MKTTIRVIAAAAMMAVASTPAFAQGAGGGGERQQMSQAERQAAQRAMMFEGITLTDAQKAKLDSIDANMMKAQQEMRASMGDQPDRQVMMQKMTEIRTKRNDEIKKLLTAEQVKLFEANLAKMPQGGGRRGGR